MSDDPPAAPPDETAAVDAAAPGAADGAGDAGSAPAGKHEGKHEGMHAGRHAGIHAEILDWPHELLADDHEGAALPPLLPGELTVPDAAHGLVVLTALDAGAHAELAQLAGELNAAGLATLIAEMLTPDETRFANLHHNTPLLTQRLLDLLALIEQRYAEGGLPELPIGLYAVGDVAPAALRATAQRDRAVAALVCRGGLIDLAGRLYLRTLSAPLLHIVDEAPAVQAVAERALARIEAPSELHPLAGGDALPLAASTLAATCALALGWFARHLPAPCRAPA